MSSNWGKKQYTAYQAALLHMLIFINQFCNIMLKIFGHNGNNNQGINNSALFH